APVLPAGVARLGRHPLRTEVVLMTNARWKKLIVLSSVVACAIVVVILLRNTSLGRAVTWQQQASPGRLSASHAFLGDSCADCHTPVTGVEPTKCMLCPANNESLLQRQPTAFHANVGSCRECHPEHQGGKRPPSTMDHDALSTIGLRQLRSQKGVDT